MTPCVKAANNCGTTNNNVIENVAVHQGFVETSNLP